MQNRARKCRNLSVFRGKQGGLLYCLKLRLKVTGRVEAGTQVAGKPTNRELE